MISQISVLLVEQDGDDADAVQNALHAAAQRAYGFTHVSDVAACVALLCNLGERFDVVLLELTLPDSSGFDTLRRVLSVASGTHVVVVTSGDDVEFGRELVRNGAQGYLPKEDLHGRGLVREIGHAIERAKLSEELAQRYRDISLAERSFKHVLDVHSDAMLILADDGTVLFANASAGLLLGARIEDLVGDVFALDDDQDECQFAGTDDTGPVWGGISSVDTVWHGQGVRLVAIRDVTNRKRAEEELRTHREHLQELVDERTRDLSRAVKALERQNQEKRDFASNASHELKTPLTSISFGIDNLLDARVAV